MFINRKFILWVLMVSGVTVNSSPVMLLQMPAARVMADGTFNDLAPKEPEMDVRVPLDHSSAEFPQKNWVTELERTEEDDPDVSLWEVPELGSIFESGGLSSPR